MATQQQSVERVKRVIWTSSERFAAKLDLIAEGSWGALPPSEQEIDERVELNRRRLALGS
jgi:hypothetical protein